MNLMMKIMSFRSIKINRKRRKRKIKIKIKIKRIEIKKIKRNRAPKKIKFFWYNK
jgi:hypothetical protein